ncbi:MAG: hypothetical protein QOF01_5408 [Thermomicrobiales bacterium]|nr:hypothetical protein [Thermomicrobiales bacterium]
MTRTSDWQRDDTVVLHVVPSSAPYSDEVYTAAASDTLAALDVPIRQKKITLKPNVVSGVAPDSGITVHPAFLRGVIAHLTARGFDPSAITVTEGGGGEANRDMAVLYAAVEYDTLAAETGVNLVDLNADDFVRVDIPDGRVYQKMPIGKTVWDPEAFFINIPKMRTHNLAVTTISIKNLQGIVVPLEERHMCTLFPRQPGDRGGDGLSGSILDTHERWAHKICDISLARKPDLNLVDAVVSRDGTGFRQGTNRPLGIVLAGINQAAVDTIGTALMGFDPAKLTYLRVAGERGMGPTRVDDIRVLEVRDGGLVERKGLSGLIADPPFRVTLSSSIVYQTYEPIEYNAAQLEPAHAEAFRQESST